MSDEKQPKPKKAPAQLKSTRPEPVVYIGPTLRQYGLAQNAIYKGEPEFVAGMREELPVLANLLVSPAKLAGALARLDAEGDNVTKTAYRAVAKKFGGA